MKEQIYQYLLDELYPVPSCHTCQYSDIDMKRVPCNKCGSNWEKYKLHKGHKADLERMTKGIIKIVENYGNISNKRSRKTWQRSN